MSPLPDPIEAAMWDAIFTRTTDQAAAACAAVCRRLVEEAETKEREKWEAALHRAVDEADRGARIQGDQAAVERCIAIVERANESGMLEFILTELRSGSPSNPPTDPVEMNRQRSDALDRGLMDAIKSPSNPPTDRCPTCDVVSNAPHVDRPPTESEKATDE